MKAYNLTVLLKMVTLLLCCFVSVSYAADKVYSGKYDHNKNYFDYYDEKPSQRHDKRSKHQKHQRVENQRQHKYQHTAFCERRHNHFVYERPRHHRRHSHHNRFNTGLSFVFQFSH